MYHSSRSSIRVSIIIPMWKVADTIAETITSALNQTYDKYEIVCVDDADPEDSFEVALDTVEKMKSRHLVKFVLNHTNCGLAGARNAGLLAASNGGAVLPLDADDLIATDYLAKTVPLLTDGVDIVSTAMQYFGTRQDLIYPQKTTIAANEMPVTSLIRRSALEAVGGWSEDVMYEDWDLWLKLFERGGQVAFVNEPLFFYRVGLNRYSEMENRDREKHLQQLRERHV